MIGGCEDLDETDLAFLDTFVPQDAMDVGLIAVVSWVDASTGAGQWVLYNPHDGLLTTQLGLLELAKAELMRIAGAMEDDYDD